MRRSDGLKIVTRWRMTAYYKGTKKVFKVLEGKNVICTVGKAQVGDMLIDETGYDTGLTYCALGAGTTTPAAGDTALEDEGGGAAMRKTITSKTRATTYHLFPLTTLSGQTPCNELIIKEIYS